MIARQHGLIGVSEQAKVVIHKIATGDIITFYLSRKKVDSPPNDLSQRFASSAGLQELLESLSRVITRSGRSGGPKSSHTEEV